MVAQLAPEAQTRYEALRAWHVAGLALVFTGIAIATRARRPAPAGSAAPVAER